jgi:hypothetical protein
LIVLVSRTRERRPSRSRAGGRTELVRGRSERRPRCRCGVHWTEGDRVTCRAELGGLAFVSETPDPCWSRLRRRGSVRRRRPRPWRELSSSRLSWFEGDRRPDPHLRSPRRPVWQAGHVSTGTPRAQAPASAVRFPRNVDRLTAGQLRNLRAAFEAMYGLADDRGYAHHGRDPRFAVADRLRQRARHPVFPALAPGLPVLLRAGAALSRGAPRVHVGSVGTWA